MTGIAIATRIARKMPTLGELTDTIRAAGIDFPLDQPWGIECIAETILDEYFDENPEYYSLPLDEKQCAQRILIIMITDMAKGN